jgi:hypothetical protein
MSVRAKFKVDRIEQSQQTRYAGDSDGKPNKDAAGNWVKETLNVGNITLFPVVSSDPNSENAKFFASTPSGQLVLGIVNEKALEQFEIGREYYVDFSEAP